MQRSGRWSWGPNTKKFELGAPVWAFITQAGYDDRHRVKTEAVYDAPTEKGHWVFAEGKRRLVADANIEKRSE